jgi:hypothetical protein
VPISDDRIFGERAFEEDKQNIDNFGEILPSTHPYSIRVTNILNQIIHALHTERNKMSSASSEYTVWLHLTRSLPPSMSHLDGLNWEVLVVDKTDIYYTHCYPCGKIVVTTASVEDYTDAHLATVFAHEVFDH